MAPISRTLSFGLGLLLAIAPVMQSRARASTQEPTESNGSQGTSSDRNSNQQGTSPDQKPDNTIAPKRISDLPDQPRGPGKASAPGNQGKSQNGKAGIASSAGGGKPLRPKSNSQPSNGKPTKSAGGLSPIQDAAQQIVKTLDAALAALPNSGTSTAAGIPLGALKDGRDQLQKEVQAAKDDAAWAVVANHGARLLADTVNAIPLNSGDLGGDAQKGNDSAAGARVTTHQAAQSRSNDQPLMESRRLPLYMASLSLVLSIIGLAIGWLLARRAVNKALTEAGLI